MAHEDNGDGFSVRSFPPPSVGILQATSRIVENISVPYNQGDGISTVSPRVTASVKYNDLPFLPAEYADEWIPGNCWSRWDGDHWTYFQGPHPQTGK
jgi:hypothetical protein